MKNLQTLRHDPIILKNELVPVASDHVQTAIPIADHAQILRVAKQPDAHIAAGVILR
jgi:hypothetical protein